MTKKLSFCLQAVKLNDEDSSALTDGIERYVKAGMNLEKAELSAIGDVLAEVRAERKEILAAVKAQYPDAANDGEKDRSPSGEAQSNGLTSYTNQDVINREAELKQANKEEDGANVKADAEAKKERDRKEIASRQDASADNFTLGQSAEDSLSGQGGMFGENPTNAYNPNRDNLNDSTQPDDGQEPALARTSADDAVRGSDGAIQRRGNNGNFDAKNSDIRYSLGNEPTTAYTPPNGLQAAPIRQQQLADRLAERINANALKGRVPAVLHAVVAGEGEPAKQTDRGRALAAVALTAKRLFGHEVVFVDFGGDPLFNGAMSEKIPGVVFIRVDSPKPLMAILGHELLHMMRQSNPGLYNQLDAALTPLLAEKGASEFLTKLDAAYKRKGLPTPNNWDEELWADVVGDNFMEPEFFKALGEEQPALFKRIITALTKYLDDIIAKLTKGPQPFETYKYLTDVRTARAAVVDAFKQFSGTQVGAMTDQQERIDLPAESFSIASQSKQSKLNLPAETKFQAMQRVLQDQYNRVKLVQNLLAENGGTVGEQQDVYKAEERMHGRVHELMRDFKDNVMQPLLDKAVKAKVDLNEFALYAYAMHAKERNAHIQTINGQVKTGSGMSETDAGNVIQQVSKNGQKAAFEDLHSDMMKITASTRKVMLDGGLITQEQFDSMKDMYQNYVPLRGFENVDADTGKIQQGAGRGFTVTGKETIAAMGRDSRAGDIIENIVRDYERATIRAEKNAVAKTFLDLVTSNPDPKIWELEPMRRAIGKDSNGLVQYQNVEDKGEDTIAVKVAGQEVRVRINDELLLRAMKNTFKGDKSDSERMVMRVAGMYTSLLRNTITRYNPVFGVINAVRDAQMGAMGVFDELGTKGVALYAKNYAGAMAAGARTEIGKSNPAKNPMDKWMSEMRFAGGTTGGVFMRDNETVRGELRDAMLAAGVAPNGVLDWAKHNTGTRAVKHVLHGLEMIGSVSEHAARLSAYATARELGKTPGQAASIAKNLTVNFNRFGEQGQLINTLFLFYNAAVQGSTRIVQMAKNPKVQAAFGGMASVGFAMAMYGASAGGDDDDGQPYWDKIPDFEKERNFIIMLPPGSSEGEKIGKHGRYIKIPMAYGLNVFPVLGYQVADMIRNQQDPTKGSSVGKAAIGMASAVLGAYNPFGGALSAKPDASWALAAAPTFIDPFIQLSQGVDGFGRSTGPQKSPFDNRPDSEIVSGARFDKLEHRIARYLNQATGGNQAREGVIDLQPGTIKNIGGIAGGGLGRFVSDMLNLGYLGVQDLPIQTRDVPIYKAFYGEYDKKAGLSLFYERSRKAMDEYDTMKAEMKTGIKRDYSNEDKFLQRMGAQADDMNKATTELKKWEVWIAQQPGSDKEKLIKRKEVQKVREKMAHQYNKDWYSKESELLKSSRSLN